jgi:pimeloyl-ACP methyl ester carboxylesterase
MTTSFLDSKNGKLAFDDQGQGPLVICVPGMGDVRGEYRFLVPQLVEAGFRTVSLDVRGHGESSPGWDDYSVAGVGADILALIRHLQAGPAVVIGTSMAAGAAVWAAAEAAELVSALVLIGPFVEGSASGIQKVIFSVLFARPWGPAVWQKYHASLFPTRKPDDFGAYSAALRANLSAPGRMEALRKMMLASKESSGQRLNKVTTPALILMGGKDPDFKDPLAAASKVAGQVHGTYRMVPGAGHYPQAEMPEITGPLILEYLHSVITVLEPVKI